jgi:hypothetical protein
MVLLQPKKKKGRHQQKRHASDMDNFNSGVKAKRRRNMNTDSCSDTSAENEQEIDQDIFEATISRGSQSLKLTLTNPDQMEASNNQECP